MLWDVLPARTCLGGAPANFAYITTLMGDRGIVVSSVGEDSRGVEALRLMEELGLDIDHMQTDGQHPTGTGAGNGRRQGSRRVSDRAASGVGLPGMDAGLAASGGESRRSVLRIAGTASEASRSTIRKFLAPLPER